MVQIKASLLLISLVFTLSATADEFQLSLAALQQQWATVNYELTGDKQLAAFENLLAEADQAVSTNPEKPELLIWRGIIKSTYAGALGGLGALKYAKASKADLEKAIAIDGEALQGSAYTSLGTLYFKVPGWPFGFGDDKKAEKLLKKALAINPDGIDPNYFFADFLIAEGNYVSAEHYLRQALKAAPRPGREKADQGRKREILAALKKVKSETE
jgi:tetratricopeptide (TPR) repeat protein